MIHPLSGEIIPFGVSFTALAQKTGMPSDELIHPSLYGFLSEFSHVHMIASGSYRAEEETIYDPSTSTDALYHTVFICTYISWLVTYLAALLPSTLGRLQEVKSDAKFLVKGLSEIQFSDEIKTLKSNIALRLSDIPALIKTK